MIRAYRLLLRYRVPVLLLLAVAVGAAALALRDRRVLSSMREVFDSDDPVVLAGRELERRFGEGVLRGVLIGFEARDALAPETLTLVARLTAALEASPWVSRVHSLTTAKELRVDGETLGARHVVDPARAADPVLREEVRAAVLAHPALVGTVVSDDSRTVGLVVKDNFTLAEFGVKNRLFVEDVERILAEETARSATRFHVAGIPVLDHTLARAQRSDEVLLLVALGVVLLLLWATFRNLTDTLVPIAVAGVTILLVDGVRVLLGFQFNMLSVVLSLIVVVECLCDTIHFAAERRARLARTGTADVPAIMQELFVPSLLTSVTTAAGVGSMVLSDIDVLRELGVAAVVGLTIEFVLFATVVPIVYSFCRDARSPVHLDRDARALDARVVVRLARLVTTRPGAVLLGSLAVAGVLLAGAARIGLEADPYTYLPRDSAVRPALDFLNERIRGVTDLEILIDGGRPEALVDADALRAVDRLQRAIERDPAMSKTFSMVEIVKQVNRALFPEAPAPFRLPETSAAVAQYLLMFSMSDAEEQLLDFVDFDYRTARVNVNLRVHSIEEIRVVAARIEQLVREHLPPALSASLSGIPLEIMAVNDELVASEVGSVVLGMVLVGALLMVAARSVRLGLLSMIPNLITVIAALGLLGWSGIGLSVGTVMLAPIAIGVAVDDAVHFLTRYASERAAGAEPSDAIARVYASTGRALLVTTVVLVCALGVQAFSSFLPLMHFGLLGLATVTLAFLANLLVLPALVSWMARRRVARHGAVAAALPGSVEAAR